MGLLLLLSSAAYAEPQLGAPYVLPSIGTASSGGGGGGSQTTPGGISSSVQFNNGTANSLGGDSTFTYIGGLLTVPKISTTGISVTGPVSASTYYGDGSHLTGISGGSSTVPASPVNSLQFNNAGAFGGSSNLTWNGSLISLIGGLTATGVVSANALDAFFVSGTSIAGASGNFTGLTAGTIVANTTSSTNITALNVSATNLYLTSNTLLAGQSLYVRNSNGALLADGSAGYQYDFNTNNNIFSSTDLAAGITPSATVHVSGTLLVSGGLVTMRSGANISGSTNLQNAVCQGTCTGFGGGGGSTGAITATYITTGTTFTTPAGTTTATRYKITLTGAGAGGPNNPGVASASGGGGGGATVIKYFNGLPSGTGLAIVIGTGGIGSNVGASSSTIVISGTTYTAGGANNNIGAGTGGGTGGNGGVAVNGDINLNGGDGWPSIGVATGQIGGNGGGSVWGGGGGGAGNNTGNNGHSAQACGAGGGGPVATGTGGNGANGCALIEWVQ